MRGWVILAGILVLIVILPIIALTGYFGELARLIGQVVLSIVLAIVLVGTGLFGYICMKAQARKWGTGLFVIAVLCLLAIFWVWTSKVLLFI